MQAGEGPQAHEGVGGRRVGQERRPLDEVLDLRVGDRRVPQAREVRRRGGVRAQARQHVVGECAEDPGPGGRGEEDVGPPDPRDQGQAADQRQHDHVGEGAVDDREHLGGVLLAEQGVQHQPRAVPEEQRAVGGEQVVVAQRVERVPALQVAVGQVDDVVADQAGQHQQHPCGGPALAQHAAGIAEEGAGRPAAGAGADHGLHQGDDHQEHQGLREPEAEHLALGVTDPDAEGR